MQYRPRAQLHPPPSFDPPRYLKPGDVIEVETENIGLLRNGVIDETT